MSTSDKQWLFLQDISRLILYAESKGYKLTGGELYRTDYQQKEYMRTKRSKTMKSNHLRRMAMDFNLFLYGQPQWENGKEWKDLGQYWESIREGNRWGGNYTSFLDLPHFENIL